MKRIMLTAATIMSIATIFAAPAVSVKTAKPEKFTESDAITCVGRLSGSLSVKLTARVVGTLWESNGDEGAEVKKGDVLYRIEDTVYKANLKSARATYDELKAKLALAEIEAQRYSAGEAKGGVSKSDRDRVVLSRDVAKAQLEAAEAQVALCENDLSYCTIKSPIDGILGRNGFDVGNNISPTSGTLRDVICSDPIDVLVAVPESKMMQAFENQKLRKSMRIRIVRADGKEVPMKFEVQAFDNKVESSTGTVLVRLRGKNPDGILSPGGYVKMIFSSVYDTPKIAIPMASIRFEGDKRFVYAVTNNKAQKKEITLGCAVGDRVFVEKGISEDDAIVISGVHKLFDGAAVVVKEK